MKTVLMIASLSLAGLMWSGCEDVDEQFDCWAICDKYAECVDEDYDVESCADSCESEADNSDAFGDKADACESCVDDRSCAEAVFPCASECAGIVP